MPQEDKYISGEQNAAMHETSSSNQPSSKLPSPNHKVTLQTNAIAGAVIVIVLCIGCFFGGIAYQKGHAKNTSISASASKQAASGRFGGGFGGGFRNGGAIGEVTSVSSTSITVENQRTNKSETYTINSSTTITNGGQPATTSDIADNDTVLIMVSSTSSTTATSIMINPSFGGGFGGGSNSGSSSGTTGTGTSAPVEQNNGVGAGGSTE